MIAFYIYGIIHDCFAIWWLVGVASRSVTPTQYLMAAASLVVGLNSGTSMDGVDAVLAEISEDSHAQ